MKEYQAKDYLFGLTVLFCFLFTLATLKLDLIIIIKIKAAECCHSFKKKKKRKYMPSSDIEHKYMKAGYISCLMLKIKNTASELAAEVTFLMSCLAYRKVYFPI